MNSYQTKILWTGDLLDARCNLAIDSSFDESAQYNLIHFVMQSYDCTIDGTLQVHITAENWVDGLKEAVCSVYMHSIVARRVDTNATLH